MAPLSAAEQLELLEVTREMSGVCVQRAQQWIQILTGSIVCINDGFDWRWLITASEMLPKT